MDRYKMIAEEIARSSREKIPAIRDALKAAHAAGFREGAEAAQREDARPSEESAPSTRGHRREHLGEPIRA